MCRMRAECQLSADDAVVSMDFLTPIKVTEAQLVNNWHAAVDRPLPIKNEKWTPDENHHASMRPFTFD